MAGQGMGFILLSHADRCKSGDVFIFIDHLHPLGVPLERSKGDTVCLPWELHPPVRNVNVLGATTESRPY